MSRTLKRDTERICPICTAKIFPGEARCKCHRVGGFKAKPGRQLGAPVSAPVGSLTAAHLYHLVKSIRSGSWAYTGHRAARNPAKDSQRASLYDAMNGGFSIGGTRQTGLGREYWQREMAYLLYRCEIAVKCWKDEFANLMSKRLTLWFSGNTREKSGDFLQLNRENMKWLDEQILLFLPKAVRGYRFPSPKWAEIEGLYRKAKAGWAADVIRRRQKGNYNPSQALLPQQDTENKLRPPTIYEGEDHVHSDTANTEESDHYADLSEVYQEETGDADHI